jgi:hypothetical protein
MPSIRRGAAALALLFFSQPATSIDLALEAGAGFTSGPSATLVTVAVPASITPTLAVGPLFQLGFGSDDRVIIAPSIDTRFTTSLGALFNDDSGTWENLEFLAHGGIGFAYLEKDRRGDDTGFLFNFGAGIDYIVSDRIALGTRMTFNVMPTSVLDEDFFFSWQLLNVRVRF